MTDFKVTHQAPYRHQEHPIFMVRFVVRHELGDLQCVVGVPEETPREDIINQAKVQALSFVDAVRAALKDY